MTGALPNSVLAYTLRRNDFAYDSGAHTNGR